MQYILSAQEYQNLKNNIENPTNMPKKKDLQKFCSYVADSLPVTKGWYKGKAWGCILTSRKDDEWYCDDCPAKDVCPYDKKSWSK